MGISLLSTDFKQLKSVSPEFCLMINRLGCRPWCLPYDQRHDMPAGPQKGVMSETKSSCWKDEIAGIFVESINLKPDY